MMIKRTVKRLKIKANFIALVRVGQDHRIMTYNVRNVETFGKLF